MSARKKRKGFTMITLPMRDDVLLRLRRIADAQSKNGPRVLYGDIIRTAAEQACETLRDGPLFAATPQRSLPGIPALSRPWLCPPIGGVRSSGERSTALLAERIIPRKRRDTRVCRDCKGSPVTSDDGLCAWCDRNREGSAWPVGYPGGAT
jgi:hypothetical protein